MIDTIHGFDAPYNIETICLASVNCYLLTTQDVFVLIDTGKPEKRRDLDARLESAGCRTGDLKLILLTHGDYDHAGNAAHLHRKHGAAVAMHRNDSGRVEQGDWSLGMKPKPDKFAQFYRIVSLFIRPGPFDTFVPDVYLDDGQTLRGFGLDAVVLHLPGHTRGSVGVLTAGGDLFCGDLMDSMMGRPGLEFFIDDMAAAQASLARLRDLNVKVVYPGHGKPFRLAEVK
ncbi:MAG: MBL fold metallo-hydrolase [Actinobacteria bacterium]|nr:MBL fold metallo-hydrolase [Actinomycetota bacterium]